VYKVVGVRVGGWESSTCSVMLEAWVVVYDDRVVSVG
jgi:hypothetical protein